MTTTDRRVSGRAPMRTLPAARPGSDLTAFEELIRTHNQRLFRVARAILRDDGDAEDAMQQAYIQAFIHMDSFAGRSALATWLTRIAIREALHLRRRLQSSRDQAGNQASLRRRPSAAVDPERETYAAELRQLVAASIDALPDSYRLVFVCRDVEGLSTAETAAALEINEAAVKTRLHRARAMLRRELFARAGATTVEAFTFHRSRCDAMVRRVFAALAPRIATPHTAT